MKHAVWACLALLFVTFPPRAAEAQTPPLATLNQDIVRVLAHRDHPIADEEAADEIGTGMIVQAGDDGVRVLTALHVVHHANRIQVVFFADKVAPVEASLLPSSNSSLDLAVLQVHPPKAALGSRGLPPLTWAPSTGITPSLHVWTVNGFWEPVPNTVIRPDSDGDTRKFDYTATSVGRGYSGAPVFDDTGRLVGIHLAEVPRQDYHVSEAVKAERAFETLQALGYNLSLVRAGATTGSVPAATALAAPAPAPGKPQLWRCLTNNQLYLVRIDAERLYIAQTNGNVVADLALREKDKHYIGRSTLSTCPNGGYMDLNLISASRVAGKVEVKPANANCGGLSGVGALNVNLFRTMTPIAFIPSE